MTYVWTILGFVLLAAVGEIASYRLFEVPAPIGFGLKELVLLFPIKILFTFVFILMFRLSRGSKLAESGTLYGFLWFLGFSVPQEVGFWLVFKYEIVNAYAGFSSGLVVFLIWGWMVKKIKLP